MSKAEKYISDCTRNCSNELISVESRAGKKVISYNEWLAPDQARSAVEIAREELIDWLKENASKFVALADEDHPPIGDTKAFYGTESLIHYLKQAMKDE